MKPGYFDGITWNLGGKKHDKTLRKPGGMTLLLEEILYDIVHSRSQGFS